MMNRIVVIGGDHHNTLGVIRSLGERGLKSDLILVSSQKHTFVEKSTYVDKYWKVSSDNNVIDLLKKEFVRNKDKKPVVICCSDSSSGMIDERYNELQDSFYLPGSKQQGAISRLMNKDVMAGLAVEVGLEIPQTYHPSKSGLDIINLPCIIKPLVSRHGQKRDIQICNNRSQLQDYFQNNSISDFQIQEYVDKDFEYQLIGCSTKNQVIIPGVSKILRPCKGSNTSFLHYTPLDKNFCEIEKCKEFVRRTGYHGLFSMEFLRDKHGKDYFMEINFRNDGNAICVTAAGMNLPFIWYLDCIEKDYSEELEKEVSPVYIMPDMAELKLLITGKISPMQYLGDFRKTTRFMEYDKKDKVPFWYLLKKEFLRW